MSHKHITRDDRVRLAVLLKGKTKKEEIGRIVKKDRSSIFREVKRGSKSNQYLPSWSEKQRKHRKIKSGQGRRKIENNTVLRVYIITHLKLYWSPEQIAGRLKQEGVVICHETIYQYIIRHKKWKKYLRCQKGRYRRRHGTKRREKQREFEKKRWIGERPDIINHRQRMGDWEGDTVIGRERTKRILTHVERVSGYLFADKLDVVRAEIVAETVALRFRSLPKAKRLSITYDNGTEFASHEIIEKKTRARVYFANPYHSWERGSVENVNGLLRQFFPKRSSFATITEGDVKRAERLLNRRPRKRLNYLTPFEVFHCISN